MPESVEIIDRKIMGMLNNFKKFINKEAVISAPFSISSCPNSPVRIPKKMDPNKSKKDFLFCIFFFDKSIGKSNKKEWDKLATTRAIKKGGVLHDIKALL